MYHAISFFLYALVSLQLLYSGDAAEKPNAGKSDNVGGSLFPALIKDFEGNTALRRVITHTIGASSIPASTTPKPKTILKSKNTKLTTNTARKPTTSETSSSPLLEADKFKFKPDQRPEYPQLDSAKAAQTQFPYDIRNNFDFPGPGLQYNGGQLNQGFFRNQAPPNSEYLRSFGLPGSPTYPSELRGNENAAPQAGGLRNPADTEFINGLNNNGPFENLEGSDRFRNFQRFRFDNRFPEQYPDVFNSPFRSQDARFQFTNYPGEQNGQDRENNYRQGLRINDYPNALNNQRRFGHLPESFPLQGYTSNNFDFLPNQRFQNPSQDNFRRQDLSNFQQFYSGGRNNGNSGNLRPLSSPLEINSNNGSASGPLPSASKNSEKLQNPLEVDRKNNAHILTEAPGNFPLQRQFYSGLNDYSDLRFRPDGGFFINSNIPAKRAINGKI